MDFISYNNLGDCMKISIIDEDNIIVFLNTINLKEMDFSNKEDLESKFKDLFLKLKYIYNINIRGYYSINIYIDKIYGAILEIEHENIEYFDYFENKVDMRINVLSDVKFIYKIKDIFKLNKELCNSSIAYVFKGKIYVLLKKNISFYNLGYLLELSDIVYGGIVDDILKLGKIIDVKPI